jgi:hypothetical protein
MNASLTGQPFYISADQAGECDKTGCCRGEQPSENIKPVRGNPLLVFIPNTYAIGGQANHATSENSSHEATQENTQKRLGQARILPWRTEATKYTP